MRLYPLILALLFVAVAIGVSQVWGPRPTVLTDGRYYMSSGGSAAGDMRRAVAYNHNYPRAAKWISPDGAYALSFEHVDWKSEADGPLPIPWIFSASSSALPTSKCAVSEWTDGPVGDEDALSRRLETLADDTKVGDVWTGGKPVLRTRLQHAGRVAVFRLDLGKNSEGVRSREARFYLLRGDTPIAVAIECSTHDDNGSRYAELDSILDTLAIRNAPVT